jgi:hypothetical protein
MKLREAIADTLAAFVKAYDLAEACQQFGLRRGNA